MNVNYVILIENGYVLQEPKTEYKITTTDIQEQYEKSPLLLSNP
jgi:hypothetical protein